MTKGSSVGRAPVRCTGGRWFESIPLGFMIVLGQKLGPVDCPYVIRWIINLGLFSIRLHWWLKSDDTRHFHDHPWNFYSVVLWGSIVDKSPSGDKLRTCGSITYFPAEHQHSVIVDKPCLTLLLCGRERRQWGYWVRGKFRKRNKYYFENGHHNPCDK